MYSEASETRKMTYEKVANEVLERMQHSGERDRIKEWLINDLESAGWTASLFEKASQLCSSKSRDEKPASQTNPAVSGASSTQSDELTVRRISSQLHKEALASVPDSVRSKLMQELLDITRQYIATESLSTDADDRDK